MGGAEERSRRDRSVDVLGGPALIHIRPYAETDFTAVDALWRRTGNYRPWNDSAKDIARCLKTPTSALLVATGDGVVVGTVMVGHDGHRGWVYYLSVDPDHQRRGLGRRLMTRAENWLREAGAPKVQLMTRADNTPVLAFYDALDYVDARVTTLEKWFDASAADLKQAAYHRTLDVTITHLEMTGRPRRLSFAKPRRSALLRLSSPRVKFYRYLYNSVGEDWLWYERRIMKDDALEAIISDDCVEIYVLYMNGAPAGYAELDRRLGNDIELAYFGLMPHAIGRGAGVWLLHEIIHIAWSCEPDRLWLHTCSLDHPRALPMYQRAGFRPYKQEAMTIADPRSNRLFHRATDRP
ncbi:MAG: GNAT family acetyltransferase [Rhodospirillaceae bacterium]|nr:GNAT family acetyltransferase [Rhodospirillaceae bacterium]MCY4311343.1 GNAT family acetyltransferase [Rhodospirillaceae bacterium]